MPLLCKSFSNVYLVHCVTNSQISEAHQIGIFWKYTKLCPGLVVQLVRESYWYAMVAGSIPNQGTYTIQPMSAWESGTTNWCSKDTKLLPANFLVFINSDPYSFSTFLLLFPPNSNWVIHLNFIILSKCERWLSYIMFKKREGRKHLYWVFWWRYIS